MNTFTENKYILQCYSSTPNAQFALKKPDNYSKTVEKDTTKEDGRSR